MSLSTLLTMAIGIGIPLLTTVVTKTSLSSKVKDFIVLFFSTVSGIATSLVGNLPVGWSAWEHVILNVVLTYAVAVISDRALWGSAAIFKDVNDAVAKATETIGVG